MTSNLKIKILVIVVVILACIYGIIGLPTSTQQLVDNWHKNIHLGLDLKGGSQLVLQVQIQDAFKAEADTVIQRLKDQLGAKGIALRGDEPQRSAHHHRRPTPSRSISRACRPPRRAISGPWSTTITAASGT